MLGKKKAKKFAEELVSKWKGFDAGETSPDSSLTQAETYINQNKRFEKAWRKFDSSKSQTGMLDMMDAHSFIRKIIPKADKIDNYENDPNVKAAEDLIAQSLF